VPSRFTNRLFAVARIPAPHGAADLFIVLDMCRFERAITEPTQVRPSRRAAPADGAGGAALAEGAHRREGDRQLAALGRDRISRRCGALWRCGRPAPLKSIYETPWSAWSSSPAMLEPSRSVRHPHAALQQLRARRSKARRRAGAHSARRSRDALLVGLGGSRAYLDARRSRSGRRGSFSQEFTHPVYPQRRPGAFSAPDCPRWTVLQLRAPTAAMAAGQATYDELSVAA